eukprot:477714_1
MAMQLRAANESEYQSLLHTATNGWNPLLFVDQHQISLCLCAYCDSICCNAAELGCDHDYDDIHLHCKDCLRLLIDSSDGKCPLNLHPNPSISLNRSIRRQVLKSIVLCPYSTEYKIRRKAQNNNDDHVASHNEQIEGQLPNAVDNACNWKGTLKDLIGNHMVECSKVNNPLLIAHARVKELNNKNMKLHQKNDEMTQSFKSKVEQLQDTLDKTKCVLNAKDKEIQSLKERINMLLLQQNDDQSEHKQDHTIPFTDSSGTVGLLQCELIGHSDQITCIVTVPGNPDLVVSGSRDCSVIVWDINTNHAIPGTIRSRLQGHVGWISDVDVSSDGEYIISSSYDGSLKLWDIVTSRCLQTIMAHKEGSGVSAVRFCDDDRLIISGGTHDRTLKIWNTYDGKLQQILSLGCSVSCISCSPLSQLFDPFFVTADSNKTLNIWKYEDTDFWHSSSLQQHKAQNITACAISPDCSLCATVNGNGFLYLWDTAEERFLSFLKYENKCNDVAFSPSRCWLCVATGDSIVISSAQTKENIVNLSCNRNSINNLVCTCIRWREDGDVLFSGYNDNKIRLWKVNSENNNN